MAEHASTPSFTARLRFATVKTTDLERSLRFYEHTLGLAPHAHRG